ncbi:GntR family transcriptional regulator [Streptomyces sp. NBC_00513]|uniref:GntR family transcriptional regulator n=1 Tax=unclassified Streptomyces TaxID=2593676 RepID=UPI002256572B|nr:GntR family transcriptional regulator [Streptomyces sp. NBC_00424]MCX5072023.1 GntR family transcriptional regulator [Streptomyces sp. NBC_00424]WUD44612.1 GntR family transcriptional regulator [Streptomyces sp. NBC_00513]
MPSPSRGGAPAAMPKYQRIAAALRQELDHTAQTPGARLPSERSLAARYQVNRQTIRAALQHLRADGLIVTGRRGTRPVAAPAPVPAAAPAIGTVPARCWVAFVSLAPTHAALLGMRGGERTLVHHRRERHSAGETLQHAVTYLSPAVVAATPELSALCRHTAVRDEDLGPLHRWLDHATATGRVAETITMTRTSHPSTSSTACGLSVRRTLHDGSGRLLAVTDLAFPTWDRLTFHRDRAAGGYRVS